MTTPERPRLGQVVEFDRIGSWFPNTEQDENRLRVWHRFKHFWGRSLTPHSDGITIGFPQEFNFLSRNQGMMETGQVTSENYPMSEQTLLIWSYGRNPLVVVERGSGRGDITLAVLRANQVFSARDFRNLTILAAAKGNEGVVETALRMDTRGMSGDYVEFVVRESREDGADYARRIRAGVDVSLLHLTTNYLHQKPRR